MVPHIVFYISIAFVLYVYLGYPVLLWFWRRIACRTVQKTMSGANASPPGRSHQEMSGANASPPGRSHQEMSGANASPPGRSHQEMSGANASPPGRSHQEMSEASASGPGRSHQEKYEPSVSIIVAAYNESASIEWKILNLLALDYPSRKVEIILSLDGPTDDTELVARKYETDRMLVLLSKRHGGKAEALNRAVARATGTILVFADARQLLDRKAVRELVSNFEDASVGAATGELMLLNEFGKEANDAMGLYWRYEKQLRSMESDIHSTVGATGALYAIRRELYRPIPSHTILDDVAIPMNAVLDGKRVVFDRAARAYEWGANSPATEFTRKVRTLTGNFQLLKQMPQLILPWRNPVFIQFVSHKVGRVLVPYFLIMLFVSNLFLSGRGYRGILALQCAWYLLASTGAVVTRRQHSQEVAR